MNLIACYCKIKLFSSIDYTHLHDCMLLYKINARMSNGLMSGFKAQYVRGEAAVKDKNYFYCIFLIGDLRNSAKQQECDGNMTRL